MANKRILVVDDEENIGRSLRLILEREGYTVSLASCIAEARALPYRADAYLVDVKLPDGTGIDLLRWLKACAPLVFTMQAKTALLLAVFMRAKKSMKN